MLLQLDVLGQKGSRQVLAVTSHGATCVHLSDFQVRQQVGARLEVVEVHLSVLPIQMVDQICHNPVSEDAFLSPRFPSRVDLEPGQVASVTFRENPNLHAPLVWLRWQVLAERKPAPETDHTLVNRVLPIWDVDRLELFVEKVHKLPNLHELVSSASRNRSVVVGQM